MTPRIKRKTIKTKNALYTFMGGFLQLFFVVLFVVHQITGEELVKKKYHDD